MAVTDEEIQIDRSDEQFSNADSPRFEIWQARLKARRERFAEFRKHFREIVVIDEGTQIDRSDEQQEDPESPNVAI
jgi:hypothetical protein